MIALCGLLLTAIFAVNAIPGASVLDYAKPVVAVLVTVRLLSLLRQDSVETKGHADKAGSGRNTRMIAIGLAIGLGAPIVLHWLITSASR
ncbi:hypothetical protein WDZ92_19535 [Nostoc sp. NIES-2111]